MHCLKGKKSDKTTTKTVENRNIKSEFIPCIRRVDSSCSTSSGPHWDQIRRNNNAIMKATKQLISGRLLAVVYDLQNRSSSDISIVTS